jgi:hypothetical protein
MDRCSNLRIIINQIIHRIKGNRIGQCAFQEFPIEILSIKVKGPITISLINILKRITHPNDCMAKSGIQFFSWSKGNQANFGLIT